MGIHVRGTCLISKNCEYFISSKYTRDTVLTLPFTQEKKPIKTVNLEDVLDVVADEALGKQNCLKMVTRDRTYFMFASSAQEAEEWIRIIKWKLVRGDE